MKRCAVLGIDRFEEFLRLASTVYSPVEGIQPYINIPEGELQEQFEEEYESV